MKTYKWYRFVFESGHVSICRGMSKHELKVAESKYGKLISKTLDGIY